jgi:hypothetical protein
MFKSTPEHLRFPPVDGLTVRSNFDGGALSSDFGHMILRGVDRHIGLTERLETMSQWTTLMPTSGPILRRRTATPKQLSYEMMSPRE